jgi:hypothetical protein
MFLLLTFPAVYKETQAYAAHVISFLLGLFVTFLNQEMNTIRIWFAFLSYSIVEFRQRDTPNESVI